ncbi:MAG: hypothetical protein Q4D14_01250 [Bacteroidales bacterium]|nr:hypothetical protein [Bacteroidales bacterium]
MGIFKAFHTPKPRQFYHRPIYYNPEEEARKEREQRLGLSQTPTDDGEYHTTLHRGSFRQKRWDAPDETSDMRRDRKNSNIRLLVILIALFALAALIFFVI